MPAPCLLALPVLHLRGVRKVWDRTHFIVLKLPVNFNLPGFCREVQLGEDEVESESVGGKALLVIVDCHVHPKPTFAAPWRVSATATASSSAGVNSAPSDKSSKKRAREDDGDGDDCDRP